MITRKIKYLGTTKIRVRGIIFEKGCTVEVPSIEDGKPSSNDLALITKDQLLDLVKTINSPDLTKAADFIVQARQRDLDYRRDKLIKNDLIRVISRTEKLSLDLARAIAVKDNFRAVDWKPSLKSFYLEAPKKTKTKGGLR